MGFFFSIILSYLIGSIPTAYIFGRAHKNIDIREHGSGNVGATNVFRVLGKGPGTIVLVLDIIKGIIPVVIVGNIFQCDEIYQRILLGLAAVIGHNWTVFLKFKGGKGIATGLGVLIGLTIQIHSLMPALLLTVMVWIISFLLTKYVSLSSILAATSLPIWLTITVQPFEVVLLGAVLCIFVVIRHRPNIKRLLKGQEPRVPLFKHKIT